MTLPGARPVRAARGGVGIGRSIHSGQATVADGTPLAAEKVGRVVTRDPATDGSRHVDAGHEHAKNVARECGLRVPMPGG